MGREVTCTGIADKSGTRHIKYEADGNAFTFEGESEKYEIIHETHGSLLAQYIFNQMMYAFLPEYTVPSFLVRDSHRIFLASKIDNQKMMATRGHKSQNTSPDAVTKINAVKSYFSVQNNGDLNTQEFYKALREFSFIEPSGILKVMEDAVNNITNLFDDPEMARDHLMLLSVATSTPPKDSALLKIYKSFSPNLKDAINTAEPPSKRLRALKQNQKIRTIRINETFREEFVKTKQASITTAGKPKKSVKFEATAKQIVFNKDDSPNERKDFSNELLRDVDPEYIEATKLSIRDMAGNFCAEILQRTLLKRNNAKDKGYSVYRNFNAKIEEFIASATAYQTRKPQPNSPLAHKCQALARLKIGLQEQMNNGYSQLFIKIQRGDFLTRNEIENFEFQQKAITTWLNQEVQHVSVEFPLLFDGTHHFLRENFGIQCFTNTEKVFLNLNRQLSLAQVSVPPVFSNTVQRKIFKEIQHLEGESSWRKKSTSYTDRVELLKILRELSLNDATLSIEANSFGEKVLNFEVKAPIKIGNKEIKTSDFVALQKRVLGEKNLFLPSKAKEILAEAIRTLPQAATSTIKRTSLQTSQTNLGLPKSSKWFN